MILRQIPFSLEKIDGNALTFKSGAVGETVRVFVLEDDIVRVLISDGELSMGRTWAVAPGMEDIPREGRDRLDTSPFSKPEFKHEERDGFFSIETGKVRMEINLDGFRISWFEKSEGGKWIGVLRDRQTQAYNFAHSLGEGPFHYTERLKDELVFGLGEKAGNLERSGRAFTMRSLDPMGYDAETSDPLYKHWPFYIARNPRTGLSYGLFYDNFSTAVFDMGRELDNYHGFFRSYHGESGELDYYFIAGPLVRNVTERFSWLTGKTIFMPKWSLGYSGSTMTYTDADNAQEQLMKFISECESNGIPCDSFQLSSGYTSINGKRYVFNWNYDKFPDPKRFAADFHDRGVRLCANIKPALLLDHPLYDSLDKKGLFLKSRDGKCTELSQFWDDLGSYVDFTNAEAYDWWKKQVTKQLLEYGIDSTWNDNNEYEVWDGKAKAAGFGREIDVGLIRPVLTLLMMKASFEAQREFAPERRPYLISRSGCPGMQRYVQTWSGDNRTAWKTIKYNIKMGLSMSLSGMYNIGHDIGGFAGDAPEPELLVRWVQNGTFTPRFTIHSWNDDKNVHGLVVNPLVERRQDRERSVDVPRLHGSRPEDHAPPRQARPVLLQPPLQGARILGAFRQAGLLQLRERRGDFPRERRLHGRKGASGGFRGEQGSVREGRLPSGGEPRLDGLLHGSLVFGRADRHGSGPDTVQSAPRARRLDNPCERR